MWSLGQTSAWPCRPLALGSQGGAGPGKSPEAHPPMQSRRRKGFREQLSHVPSKQLGFLLCPEKAGSTPSPPCPYPSAPSKQQLRLYAAFPLFSTDT